MFFGGEGAHLLLHALHVALSEFDDAGYVVLMSDSAVVLPDHVAALIENLGITEGAHRILQCEHKVFFSHSFMKTHAPQPISIK
jgi:hypothetical protein